MKNKLPELLAPAGDMEKLRAAVLYGADAVYLAGAEFGMRSACANFGSDLAEAVEFCHDRGVCVYAAVNTMPRNEEAERISDYLRILSAAGADAVIVADVGVLSLARKTVPSMPVHVSTQASVVNYISATAWHELGADRVILARELSLPEIAEIRAKTPSSLELEAFVHGSMCVSYSGRCLLSDYLTGRGANRGECAQPCRWKYNLVEELRPGQYMEIIEDTDGTHIMNSKDLCMIGAIDRLAAAGVNSFKIEGRAKTAYYTAVITNAYRRAVDLYGKSPDAYHCPDELLREVDTVSHREYWTGFYFNEGGGQHTADSEYIRYWDVAAVVEQCDADGNACLLQKNRFTEGDRLELLLPGVPAVDCVVGGLRDEQGSPITEALHPHSKVFMRLPAAAPRGAMLRKQKKV